MADKQVVLITGANTGIGYETVKALYASPHAYTILMGSRTLSKAHSAISKIKDDITTSVSEIVPLQVDIEDDESIGNAFQEVSRNYNKLDTLVNNAGASYDGLVFATPGAKGIRAAWDRSYSINVTSTQVMTHTFAPLLLQSPSPRLLFLTSGLSSLTTCAGGFSSKLVSAPPPKGWPKPPAPSAIAYRSSKVALNMMMLDWVTALKPDGVRVFAISPGFLATGLGGMGADKLKMAGAGEPSVGGELIRDVIEGKRDTDAGKVVNKDGVQAW